MLTATLLVAGATIFLPYKPLGALFGFVPLPPGSSCCCSGSPPATWWRASW
jgi:hypothetical protein